jgi:hypothetical protein
MEFTKVNAFATKFIGDITIPLKSPLRCHGVESDEEQPHGSKVMCTRSCFSCDLTAKHKKIKESGLVCIPRMVVLAHKLQKQIICAGNGQRSNGIIQVISIQLFLPRRIHVALDAALAIEFHGNLLAETVVVL